MELSSYATLFLDLALADIALACYCSLTFTPPLILISHKHPIYTGVTVKKGAVLGSGSLAPEDFTLPAGSVWVGSQQGCAGNSLMYW